MNLTLRRTGKSTLLLALLFLFFTTTQAQMSNLNCNADYADSAFNLDLNPDLEVTKSWWWSNTYNGVDGGDPTNSNYASVGGFLGMNSWYRITDPINTYTAGTYAGFNINIVNISIGSLGTIWISTYLDGVEQESKSYTSADIIEADQRFDIGFVSTKDFDAVQVRYVAAAFGIPTFRVHNGTVVKLCSPTDLVCNELNTFNRTDFPVVLNDDNTGVTGLSWSIVTGEDNLITSDKTDYANLTNVVGVAGSASLSVEDVMTEYPAGTYAGYEIQNIDVLGLEIFNYFTVTTYLNGVAQESRTGDALAIDISFFDFSRRTIGFVTEQPFDEIQITRVQPIGFNLGSTRVYNAVVKKACEGADLVCNTLTRIGTPAYPVSIGFENTGISGVACTACSVTNTENVIDGDAATYANITVPATIGTQASISVVKALSNWTAGSYVAFDVEHNTLINTDILNATAFSTYKDGVLQEVVSGEANLFTLNSDLAVGDGRAILGFVTTKDFDEIKYSVNSTASLDFGTFKVYDVLISKSCPTTLDCDNSYYLARPTFSAYINADRTGIQSAACSGCTVSNPDALTDEDNTNSSTINLLAGVASTGSISVINPSIEYPAGTFAGFTVNSSVIPVSMDLLDFITIRTYLNDVLQESITEGDLLSLDLLIPIWGNDTGNIGFYTTKAFDEIEIQVSSLASALRVVDVYGAFIDTRTAYGGSLFCNTTNAVNDSITVDFNTTYSGNILTNDTDPQNEQQTVTTFTYTNASGATATVMAGTTVTAYGTNGEPAGTLCVFPNGSITFAANDTYVGPVNAGYTITDNNASPATDTANIIIDVVFIDSDGDGVPDSTEVADGTDPNNGCDFNAASQIYAQVTTDWKNADCDGDGVTNDKEMDPDGDGVPGPNGTDLNNGCDYDAANQDYSKTTQAWKDADCDGDGVTNGKEVDPDGDGTPGPNGTDPNDPCSLTLAHVTLTATSTGDCDGDGVPNKDEINSTDPTTDPQTDPNNPCDYNAAEQNTANASAAWKAADCDGDGNPNDTDPNPKTPTAVDDAFTAPYGETTTHDILANDDFLKNDGNTITQVGGTAAGTVSFDPVTGLMSYTPTAAEENSTVTVVYKVCQGTVCAEATVTITVPVSGDSDGDGVTDAKEVLDGTDPNNGCSYETASQDYSKTTQAWKDADCDGDGVTNGKEVDPDGDGTAGPNGTDPKDACSLTLAHVTLIATSTGDCDGDGVPNKDEINSTDPTTDPQTDPNNPCDYNAAEQNTANASAAWKAADCDGDGNPNDTDPNPKTPTATDDAFTAPYGSTTTHDILANDDFLKNDGNTITQVGGTAAGTVSFDPVTGLMSYTPTAAEENSTVTVVYKVCQGTVCAEATVTITVPVSGDSDGDGVTDAKEVLDGTDPNNGCSYETASQDYSKTTQAWKDADCDGDGVTNGKEVDPDGDGTAGPNGTDPKDACSLTLAHVTLTATSTGDCDGDGVPNKDEINSTDPTTDPQTDPNNPCDYNAAEQNTANASAAWKAADCDGDGNPNDTDPNPKTPTATDDAFTAPYGSTTTHDILANDDFLKNDGNTITQVGGTAAGTVSFDPVTGLMSYTPTAAEENSAVTVVYKVCQGTVCAEATVTITVPVSGDSDGDGVTDAKEVLDGTDPNNGCSYETASQDYSKTTAAWKAGDCDGDGVTNGKEVDPDGDGTAGPNGTDPKDACSLTLAHVTLTATSTGDCDGDGVPNKDEINSTDPTTDPQTDPNNPCDYNAAEQNTANASAAWKAADCDGDGNPNDTDPNPKTPTAVDDAFTAPYGETTTHDILANDDFLKNDGNTITQVGGTAAGTVSFDPVTGLMSYTPTAAEENSTVTVVYKVCQGTVCAEATVTITVPVSGDSDGDGVTDAKEVLDGTDPNNGCSYETASQDYSKTTQAWKDADCDGDGVTNGKEVDPDGDGTAGPNGTDPKDPCSLNLADVTLVATSTGDCDGDGVPNKDEINSIDPTTDPQTDPNNPCDYNAAEQNTANASAAWKAADCDGDGNPNDGDPNPKTPTATDDAFTAPYGSTTTHDILANDDFLKNDGNTITQVGGTAAGTVSFDPVTGLMSYTPTAAEENSTVTVVYKVCQGTVCAEATVTITVPVSGDSDGDGVTDAKEVLDGTDPNNGCSYETASQDYSKTTQAWKDADCDGDGVTNGKEVDPDGDGTAGPNGTDPKDACSLTLAHVTLTATSTGDCDGDGVPNKDEINSIDPTTDPQTDPNNPCDYNAAEQNTANASAAWKAADCDGDGNPNDTDPNPKTPTAVDDAFNAPAGEATSHNILENDDYLANDGNTIAKVGGTAVGTESFDPVAGTITYTPITAEEGTDVTVVYEVCQDTVCAQATVTITVPAGAGGDVPDLAIAMAKSVSSIPKGGTVKITYTLINLGPGLTDGSDIKIDLSSLQNKGVLVASTIPTEWSLNTTNQIYQLKTNKVLSKDETVVFEFDFTHNGNTENAGIIFYSKILGQSGGETKSSNNYAELQVLIN